MLRVRRVEVTLSDSNTAIEAAEMSNSEQTQVQDDDEREDARQLSLQGSDPPSEIEGYSILRRLGTGAYGTVWLAREDHTGRMVAIKYYPHRRGLNWSLLNREVEKLATLYASRNIVRLLDVGWNAEPPYYVMEYVENGSLATYLTGGPLDVDETVRITEEVCGALIEAHGAGVLHCDLKPDNVLLDAQFLVRLCDFGQSRMSHEQSPALGTLYYMAPEQADLEAVPDARWDVYAVGALMYHMLTGQPPYREPAIQQKLERAESLQERLQLYQRHIRDSPAPDLHRQIRGVDRHLASVIDQCLAVDPQERLPNAQAIRTQLTNRARNRARRPLLLLGVLGPVLLIAAMVPIFVSAMSRIIRETEAEQIADTLDANQLTARSQANAIQSELQYRLAALEDVVADSEIRALLADVTRRPTAEVIAEARNEKEKPDWIQRLNAAREKADRRNDATGKNRDVSWFLTDAAGNQLWRMPLDQEIIGKNFAWRDYFHGRDKQFDPGNVPDDVQPIQQPHVSLAFISRSTHRYMVALSVPVKSEDGTVIGVFARTLHLGELLKQLGQDVHGENSSRVIALADRRESVLLDHPWLTDEVFAGVRNIEDARRLFAEFRLSNSDIDAIRAAVDSRDSEKSPRQMIDIRSEFYRDPIGRQQTESARRYQGDYIAAMSTISNDRMPWLVIVQQSRSAALLPVQEMQKRATRQAWLAVLASVGTMLTVWLFVWQALSRAKESPLRRNGRI